MAGRFSLPGEFVVVDTETTGMRPEEGHSIIELAAQKIRGREVVDQFLTLVNPGHGIDPETAVIHGITEIELIASGKRPHQVFPAFAAFVENLPLVGHNVGFDLAFLNAHHQRLGLPQLSNPLIDSIALAKQLLILPSYSLEAVARFLKVPQPERHRALADVETLRQVLFALADRQLNKAVSRS